MHIDLKWKPNERENHYTNVQYCKFQFITILQEITYEGHQSLCKHPLAILQVVEFLGLG